MKAIQVSKPGGPEALGTCRVAPSPSKSQRRCGEDCSFGRELTSTSNLRSGAYKSAVTVHLQDKRAAGVITVVGDETKSLRAGDRVGDGATHFS